ncbi:MAG: hypothetical protein EXR62_15560 [Chloroflexi bacterium]|nr:hypothetical protein [Chloroflexota bacterium]
MFRKIKLHKVAAVLAALLLTALFTGVAFAHDHRDVGKYTLTVGWTVEPAFEGQKNGIDFRVAQGSGNDAKPVEGLEKTVKVQVTYGGKNVDLPLTPVFGKPGAYTADIMPTRAGTYTFHFTGKIVDQNIDEKFVSGDHFDNVDAATGIMFPETNPSAQDMSSQLAQAQADAAAARTLGLIGIVVGILGLVVGAGAWLMQRRSIPMQTRPQVVGK